MIYGAFAHFVWAFESWFKGTSGGNTLYISYEQPWFPVDFLIDGQYSRSLGNPVLAI